MGLIPFPQTLLLVLLFGFISSLDNSASVNLAQKIFPCLRSKPKGAHKDVHVNKEFGQIASIITSKSIRTKDLGAKLSDTIANESMIQAGKLMLAIVFANGNIELDNKNRPLFKVATKPDSTSDTVAAALTKCFTQSDIRRRLNEKYTKRMEAGMNSLEAMSSALEDSVTGSKDYKRHFSQNNKEFRQQLGVSTLGCRFEDDVYTYGKDTNVKDNPSALGNGQWAKDDREAIVFNDMKALKSFLTVLGKQLTHILRVHRYNDVDQLIRFVSELKFQNKTLEEFYNNYKYKFRPTEKLEFKTEDIEMSDKFYLTPALRNVPMKYFANGKEYESEDPLDEDNFQGHVAGAYNIEVRDGHHKGYILLIPALRASKPIVLFEDEVEDFGDVFETHCSPLEGRFKLVKKDRTPLVVVELYSILPFGQERLVSRHMYYVGKPFCDFVQDCYKPNLLRPKHRIMKFKFGWNNWVPIVKARIDFRVAPNKDNDYSFNMMNLVLQRVRGAPVPDARVSGVVKFDGLFKMTVNQGDTIDGVAYNLGLSPAQLVGKMVAVKMLIFDDPGLVAEIYNLNRKLEEAEKNGDKRAPQ